MRTDFAPFKKGDVVFVVPNHPFAHPMLYDREEWTISIMIADAGIVCLEEIGKEKTFPEEIFVLKHRE
jgi:hypothetical protein